MADDSFGVLPWTTEQFELQHEEMTETFPKEFFNFPSGSSFLKIVYPAAGYSMYELERTVTNFLRYFAGVGNYDRVIWLGADNIAVTLNYICHLLQDQKIQTTKYGALRSLSDVLTDLFNCIAYECEQNERKALVIYSAANNCKAVNNWEEIDPFLLDGLFPNIDFMILTVHPKRFEHLVKEPELGCLIPCRLQSELIERSSQSTYAINQKLVYKAEDDASREALKSVLLLVSFLYPNMMTEELVTEAIEFIAEGDENLQRDLENALDGLINSYILRKVHVGGELGASLCIDQRFQDRVRTEVDLPERKAMAEKLQNFLITVMGKGNFSEVDLKIMDPHQILFLPYGSGKYQFLGTEVAMHQSWLMSVSALGLLETHNVSLVEVAVEYVNLFIIGKISMFYRQETLGPGNHEVFRGYHFEPYCPSAHVAVKCVPKIHGSEKKLKREIRNLKELKSSPNVVAFIDVAAEPRGSTYIALELCNQNLGQWVEAKGQVNLLDGLENLTQRFKLLRDATEGLKFLVSKGVLHRDIKPANILLKQEGPGLVAKLADFDLSKYIGEDATATLTNVGGTEGYRAPEIRNDSSRGTHKSDMYAFGKVCYFVLSCGRSHFDNFGPIDFPFDFYGTAKTVEALLETDPSKRPSAEELLEYPMFWMAEERDRDKFADFIAKVIIQYGTDGSAFHADLRMLSVNWQSVLKSTYGDTLIEEAINYRQGGDPSKPPAAKKRKDQVGQEFGPDYAGYLRFTRNAILHAVDRFRDTRANVQLWKRYMDATGKPLKWEYFETYFKVLPTFFFTVWKLAADHSDNATIHFNAVDAFERLYVLEDMVIEAE